MNTLSLYIHYPFCAAKCRYCSFVSRPGADEDIRGAYIDLLIRELEFAALTPETEPRPFSTIYFGGGTPSLMPPEDVGRILSAALRLFGIATGAEISIECNPGSVKKPAEYLAALRAAGVNRAVVGVQSFDPKSLKFLGRIHSAAQAVKFFDSVRNAGFASAGLDLIYGLPGQSVADWQRDLEKALSLNPDHISLYCLEITADTPLGHALATGEINELEPEIQSEMYTAACETLDAFGLRQYEISNFAYPGHECRHNLAYWTDADYLGIGVSACSHLRGWRWENERDPEKYEAKLRAGMLPRGYGELLSPGRRLRERAVMALRTNAGYKPRVPENMNDRELLETLERLTAEGLLQKSPTGAYCIPQKFRFVSDSILSKIV